MIRFDRLIVSLEILLDSITEVSEIFNFRLEDATIALFNESIRLDNEMVSFPILSETY